MLNSPLDADRAQGHALIQLHVLAEHGGLADHVAGSVVDRERRSDLRAGVDVDARGPVRDFADEAREQSDAPVRIEPSWA